MAQNNSAWREIGFTSEDAAVILRIPALVAASASSTAESFWPLETGGLILGRYTSRRTVLTLTAMLPPPPDSLHGRYDFYRGTVGVREAVAEARAEDPSVYVAGEWHTHPGGAPCPSRTDHRHMKRFARRGLYGCSSPVLLILGGNAGPDAPWGATLYRRWRHPLPLLRAW